jgi:hypothetical protein
MGCSMIIVNQEKLKQLNDTIRTNELKKFLSDSDFRMTHDYFSQMSFDDQRKWTEQRQSWREELRGLNAN